MKNFHTLTIRHASNGIIVKAGCLEIVYQEEHIALCILDLQKYFSDPKEAEKMIRERWEIDQSVSLDQPEEAESETVRSRPSREAVAKTAEKAAR